MEIIAHRGSQGLMPENTLEAYRHAIKLGCTAIDADIVVSKDKFVVVYHDLCINPARTKNRDGKFSCQRRLIKDLTFGQLQEYTVGELQDHRDAPSAKQMSGVHIPSLEQVFQMLNEAENRHVAINLEFKNCPNFPELSVDQAEFVHLTVVLLNKYNMMHRVFFQSFDWHLLLELKRITLNVPILAISSLTSLYFDYNLLAHLFQDNYYKPRKLTNTLWGVANKARWRDWFSDYTGNKTRLTAANSTDIICSEIKNLFGTRGQWSPDFRDLSAQHVRICHDKGLKVFSWTLKEVADTKKALAWGVDAVFHDRVDIAFDVIKQSNLG